MYIDLYTTYQPKVLKFKRTASDRKKMHNLKVASYVLFRDLTENYS